MSLGTSSLSNHSRPLKLTNAVYTEHVSLPKLPPRNAERDPISLLNERIRRDHSKRDGSSPRPAMDSDEAERYIQLVKEQQQRGLQKLKGDRAKDGKGGEKGFSYKVDPYTLRSGDYVVHKKVGIGRFVSIKFDVPKGSNEPVEYVFIEYADGMAKLPVKQASRMLYRYNLYVSFIFLWMLLKFTFWQLIQCFFLLLLLFFPIFKRNLIQRFRA